MSKFLLLNKDNVIIDIVDTIKYVCRNTNDLVVLCTQAQAQGYIGSDNETVYPKAGAQLVPDYSDIAKEAAVADVDEDVTPLAYKFDFETEKIVANKDPYPESNITLTNQTAKLNANIEYIAMMSDIEI